MRFTFAFVLTFFLSFISWAQSPAKVLKQAEKALGGIKALQAVHSISKTGRITRISDGVSGQYRYKSAQPNLLSTIYDVGGEEQEISFNGSSGWARDPRGNLFTLTAAPSIHLQAKAAFSNNLWLNYKADKSKIVSGGTAKVGTKTANILALTTAKGITIKLFFDASSGLLLREELPNGDSSETIDLDDYRDISGTKQAFFNRVTIDGQTYEIRFDEIKINPAIAKSEFDFPAPLGSPLPDIRALLNELQANEDRVEDLLDTYSYIQKIISREVDKNGVLQEKSSETYQLSFYKGYRIRRMIEKNGKPLSADDQAGEDKKAAKQAAEIEKKIAEKEKDPKSSDSSEEDRKISIAEMLRASRLLNPRRERFRSRDVIVFDFEPNPDFDYKNAKSMLKFFGKIAGVMWIDEQDKQVARIDAHLADSFNIGGGVLAKLKKGSSFTLDQDRINDEIWLPSVADINLSLRVLMVKGIDLNQVVRAYDYRKFTTEVKNAEVKDVAKP